MINESARDAIRNAMKDQSGPEMFSPSAMKVKESDSSNYESSSEDDEGDDTGDY